MRLLPFSAGTAVGDKREPGTGCAALPGINRVHAVFGARDACIATHPSDMSVALSALDATVRVRGPRGERSISFADFYRLPGDRPERDTILEPAELIVSVDLPAFKERSRYRKGTGAARRSAKFSLPNYYETGNKKRRFS